MINFQLFQINFEISKPCGVLKRLLLKTSSVLLTKVAGSRQLDKHIGLGLIATIGQNSALKHLQKMCKRYHYMIVPIIFPLKFPSLYFRHSRYKTKPSEIHSSHCDSVNPPICITSFLSSCNLSISLQHSF